MIFVKSTFGGCHDPNSNCLEIELLNILEFVYFKLISRYPYPPTPIQRDPKQQFSLASAILVS